jgi:hypothetical protein
MNVNDDELQKSIERNDSNIENSIDAEGYKVVFQALSKPRFEGTSVADKVIQRIIAMREKRENRKDFLWFFFGVFVLLIGLAISLVFASEYIKVDIDSSSLSGILAYKELIVISIIMVVLFNWLDKKFVAGKAVE